MAALTKYFPLAIIMLIIILVMLFGNFQQPLIIFLILPLSLIGMVFGLLLTGFQFGFFCIAGWLGLLGMIIKNVIVLLDEVNVQRRAGIAPYAAVIEATVSRVRPVLMAALTTVFGSIPLLFDVVFGGMAATIVFGLSFATLLTLFVTPALYAIFYKIYCLLRFLEIYVELFLNFTNYKRMNKWIILCLMCVSAQAQAQHNKLLQEYRTKVKAYNQDIKAAGYAASIQQEKEKSAKADFLPSLSGNANFNYTGNPAELSVAIPSLFPAIFRPPVAVSVSGISYTFLKRKHHASA